MYKTAHTLSTADKEKFAQDLLADVQSEKKAKK